MTRRDLIQKADWQAVYHDVLQKRRECVARLREREAMPVSLQNQEIRAALERQIEVLDTLLSKVDMAVLEQTESE